MTVRQIRKMRTKEEIDRFRAMLVQVLADDWDKLAEGDIHGLIISETLLGWVLGHAPSRGVTDQNDVWRMLSERYKGQQFINAADLTPEVLRGYAAKNATLHRPDWETIKARKPTA
jgi:hypothetical protein